MKLKNFFKKKKVLKTIVIALIILITVPIVFGILIGKTSLFPNAPFSSDIWFEFWWNYLGILLSLFLDLFAVVFSFYVFNDDKISSKTGTISINDISLQGYVLDDKIKIIMKLIDYHPHLTDYNEITFSNFKIFICLNSYVFFSEDAFDKSFEVNDKVKRYLIEIPVEENVFTKRAMIDNERLLIDIECETNNPIMKELFYMSKYLYNDSKMMILRFDYKITNTRVYFRNGIINQLYKKNEEKEQTQHQSLIYFIRDNDGNEKTNSSETDYSAFQMNKLQYRKEREKHELHTIEKAHR